MCSELVYILNILGQSFPRIPPLKTFTIRYLYLNVDDALQQNAEMYHKFYQTIAMVLCSLRIQPKLYTVA
jgi:hypothetical protein